MKLAQGNEDCNDIGIPIAQLCFLSLPCHQAKRRICLETVVRTQFGTSKERVSDASILVPLTSSLTFFDSLFKRQGLILSCPQHGPLRSYTQPTQSRCLHSRSACFLQTFSFLFWTPVLPVAHNNQVFLITRNAVLGAGEVAFDPSTSDFIRNLNAQRRNDNATKLKEGGVNVWRVSFNRCIQKVKNKDKKLRQRSQNTRSLKTT